MPTTTLNPGVSTRAAGPGAGSPAAWWRSPARVVAPIVIAVAALCGRLVPVLAGGGLSGRDTYDPYVYYGGAVALSAGRLPYRDFLLLHPPGILLVLQPFAVLGAVAGDAVGMAAARLAFMSMGAASAVLVYQLLRRHGQAGALVGSGLYAVWFPAFYVERDVRLEAVSSLVLLLGLAAVARLERGRGRRLGWAAGAGALVGFTVVVKVWGVVPLTVLLGWLFVRYGVRAAAAALAGAAGVIAAVMVPFATAAPNWLQLIVFDQLGRSRDPRGWDYRLLGMIGLGPVPPVAAGACLVAGCVLTVAALALGCRTPLGRLHAALAVAGGAVLLAGPTWYPHYPAFIAAPLCLLYGNAAGVVLGWIRQGWAHRAASAAVATLLAAALVTLVGQSAGLRFPGARLAAALEGRDGCVTSDRTAALVLTGSLRRNLARGCPVVVDIQGYKFIGQSGDRSGAETRGRYQRLLVDYLATGSSAILVRQRPAGLEPALRDRVLAWPVVGQAGRYQVRATR
ncbi:MAG: glycosyltransferase 87 family protein [Propionicimonas sp.]|nr:glycosyltransferase 87 family protein [Propionicimonas sp.]